MLEAQRQALNWGLASPQMGSMFVPRTSLVLYTEGHTAQNNGTHASPEHKGGFSSSRFLFCGLDPEVKVKGTLFPMQNDLSMKSLSLWTSAPAHNM